MRVGLIARGEDRGLGHLTYDFFRGFGADRVLLVDMGDLARGFPVHAERYPNATRVEFRDSRFDEGVVREWLDGLDVVYSAETFYDWRVVEWCERARVASVCHLMPEFWKHEREPYLPTPTHWWTPTSWRREFLPHYTRFVPIPVPVDCWGPGDVNVGPLSFVHVAGHRAAQDRAGTVAFMRALQHLREPCNVRVVTQDNRLPSTSTPGHVELSVTMNGVENRWNLYRGADALVSPRRYGGLSLPVQEALGMGLGVVMSDCPPNRDWPIHPIPVVERTPIRTGAGIIDTYEPTPVAVAATMDECSILPAQFRADAREVAWRWAREHSWSALRPVYEKAFGEAIGAR